MRSEYSRWLSKSTLDDVKQATSWIALAHAGIMQRCLGLRSSGIDNLNVSDLAGELLNPSAPASIEQIGEPLLDLIRHVQRDGLQRGRGVHATRSHEHTAIDDEEVLHIVAAAPFIDH